MNKDFVQWLATQRLPMFDIRKLRGAELWDNGRFMNEAYVVFQQHPRMEAVFDCTLNELQSMVQEHFPLLCSPVGELALKTAIDDLRLKPWWGSAGPITEEIRFVLREGFKNLTAIQGLKYKVR